MKLKEKHGGTYERVKHMEGYLTATAENMETFVGPSQWALLNLKDVMSRRLVE